MVKVQNDSTKKGISNPAFKKEKDDLENQIQSVSSIEKGKKDVERTNWSNPVEFILSCIAMSVGLGNIWRFPYIAYKNGGGAFLIPYLIVLTLIGRPFYFLELVLGQFTSSNGANIYEAIPLLRGVGYAQTCGSWIVVTYYSTLIMLGVRYLIDSFSMVLPWSICQEVCSNCTLKKICIPLNSDRNAIVNKYFELGLIEDKNNVTISSSAEVYFKDTILSEKSNLEEGLGLPKLELIGTLFIVYVMVFLSLCKGVKSSGKVAYITAIFPYIILITLVVRGSTLPGAVDGILFYLTPQWEKIISPQVWYNAVGQSFFSLAVGYASLPALASYNKFDHNCYRDAWIISLVDTFTSFISGFAIFSVLGNLAQVLDKDIEDVVGSGTSLAFISYATAIAKFQYLPQVFSVLFFLMLITLGMGSVTGLSTGVLGVICDAMPSVSVTKITLAYSVVSFLIGTVYVTEGGQSVLTVIDSYGGNLIVFFFAILEAVAWGYIYGTGKLVRDIKFMLNISIGYYWKLCWTIFCPIALATIFVYTVIFWEEPEYNNAPIPEYILNIGRGMALIVALQFVLVLFFEWKKSGGFFNALKPSSKWGPKSPKVLAEYKEFCQNWESRPKEKSTESSKL